MARMKSSTPLRRRFATALVLGAIALWQCGCIHNKLRDGPNGEELLSRLEALATGPAALVLTNLPSYTAECTIALAGDQPVPRQLSARLAVSGGQLRLETVPRKSKSASAEGFGVIWDANGHRGFVFSDALQGYAALSGTVVYTNLQTSAVAAQPGQMAGHAVTRVDMTADGDNGQQLRLQLECATDLGNLPLQIRCGDGPGSYTLTLANVQPGPPAADLFLAPDGFTKFASAAALADELAGRQQNVFGEHSVQGGPPGGVDSVPSMRHDRAGQ